MGSCGRRLLVLIVVVAALTGVVVPVPLVAEAQTASGSTASGEVPESAEPLRDRPVVSDPVGPGPAGESSGSPVFRVDPDTGRTVWELPRPAGVELPEGRGEVGPGVPVVPPVGDRPVGFVPGTSEFVEGSSDRNRHVFVNPDGSVSVLHTASPSVIDLESGLPAVDTPAFERRDGDWVAVSVGGELRVQARTNAGDEGARGLARFTDGVTGSEFGFSIAGQIGGVEAEPAVEPGRSGGLPDGFGGRVRTGEVLPGVSAEVSPVARGFKVDFVAESAVAATGIIAALELPEGWSAEQAAGLIVLLDEAGERAGYWSGGPLVDSAGVESFVRLGLVGLEPGRVSAVLVVDEEWLADPARVFPVLLDPTVNFGAVSDTWVSETTASQPGSQYLQAGVSSGVYSRSYLEFSHFFDAFADSEGFRVTSAELHLVNMWSPSCADASRWIRRVSEGWDPATLTWANKPASVEAGKVNNVVTFGASGCPDNWVDYDVTGIVQHWATNPGSNHGFELRSDEVAGAGFKQYYSSDYSTSGLLPYMTVTYATHSAYYDLIGDYQGTDFEVLMPVPGNASTAEDGVLPVEARNRGVLNWPGAQPTDAGPVCLSYHITSAGATPPAPTWAEFGNWPVGEGLRTCPSATSNMWDLFSWDPESGNPQPQPASGWLEPALTVKGHHYSTPGVRDVYVTAVNEGYVWFEIDGSEMMKVPLRWTAPPVVSAPADGGTFSVVEPIGFDVGAPYAAGQSGVWAPSEYRVTFYNALSQQVGDEVRSPSGQFSVDPEVLGDEVGPLFGCVQARDASLEITDGPEVWTRCQTISIVRTGAVLGSNPLSESFAGVDAATGNFYLPFTDFNVSGVADGFRLTRHVNSSSDSAGIFGPGITTAFEGRSAIQPPGAPCWTDPTSDGCTMVIYQDDGNRLLLERDPDTGVWTDLAGGPVTGEIDTPGNDFVVTYKDGSTRRYDSWLLGEITSMVSPEGHELSVVLDPAKHYHPATIRDEQSGREIELSYVDLDTDPNFETWQVSRARMVVDGQNLDWTYSYVNGFLDQACDPRTFCLDYDWFNHDGSASTPNKLRRVTWPVNSRKVTLDYDTSGRVIKVTDGATDTTQFSYPSTSQTVVTDPRGNVWTVDFDDKARVTSSAAPSGSTTTHSYSGAYRVSSTDGTARTATLDYDDDGNLRGCQVFCVRVRFGYRLIRPGKAMVNALSARFQPAVLVPSGPPRCLPMLPMARYKIL